MAYEKDFKSGWFKKNVHFLIDTIDNILNDQSFTYNTVRVAFFLLSNLNNLQLKEAKVYLKSQATIDKIE